MSLRPTFRSTVAALVVTVLASLVSVFGTTQPAAAAGYCWSHVYQNTELYSCLGGQTLSAGQYWRFGRVDLMMQNDGNLVLYRAGKRTPADAVWSSRTFGTAARAMVFQADGNLVLYTADRKRAIWSTNSQVGCTEWGQGGGSSARGTILARQSDSNLVIYCAFYYDPPRTSLPPLPEDVLWASNTRGV